MVLAEHACDAHDAPDAKVVSIGPALIFERLWRETGCQEVLRKRLATRHHHFDVERAVFMTVLHRLLVSGSDRSALQWRRDQAIDATAGLELQHLYRAMGWLGEALGEPEPDAPSPRRTKDLIEADLTQAGKVQLPVRYGSSSAVTSGSHVELSPDLARPNELR